MSCISEGSGREPELKKVEGVPSRHELYEVFQDGEVALVGVEAGPQRLAEPRYSGRLPDIQ